MTQAPWGYPFSSQELESWQAKLRVLFDAYLSTRSVKRPVSLTELRKFFRVTPEPLSSQGVMEKLEAYLTHATHLQSPQYMGHQVALPDLGVVLADSCLSLSNNSCAVFDMGAAGVAAELEVIAWLLELVGWKESSSGGVLTHGGSLANLTALCAARARAFPEAWAEGCPKDVVLVCSELVHYCNTRPAGILGVGSKNLVLVETDARGCLNPLDLSHKLGSLKKKGKRVLAVVASSGVTANGAFDPIDDICDVVEPYGHWIHLDAAHGGPYLMSPRFRDQFFQGVSRVDSLVWDFHKMARSSALCAAVLFRDRSSMETTFSQDASYLKQKSNPIEDSLYLYPYVLECTKPSIGLKAYMALQAHGEQGLRQHVEGLALKAQEFSQVVLESSDFELAHEPFCNILLFRYRPAGEGQREIYNQVMAEGDFHITYVVFKGLSYLRLTLMNPLTQKADFLALLDRIRSLNAR